MGKEGLGENRRATVSRKESRSPGWEKRNEPSRLCCVKSFPWAFCLCARGCAAGGAAVPARRAPCPAPPPCSRGCSSPSPRGAKWLPSQSHGAGAAAPPPAAAAPGARGLGAGARRWKRTPEAGRPGLGWLGRSPDSRPAPLRPRGGARPALTAGLSHCSSDAPPGRGSPRSGPQGDGRPSPERAERPGGPDAARRPSRVSRERRAAAPRGGRGQRGLRAFTWPAARRSAGGLTLASPHAAAEAASSGLLGGRPGWGP